jgi:hypothetical protein
MRPSPDWRIPLAKVNLVRLSAQVESSNEQRVRVRVRVRGRAKEDSVRAEVRWVVAPQG